MNSKVTGEGGAGGKDISSLRSVLIRIFIKFNKN